MSGQNSDGPESGENLSKDQLREQLKKKHWSKLFYCAYSIVGDNRLARSIVEIVIERVLEKYYGQNVDFGGLLYVSVKNESLKQIEKPGKSHSGVNEEVTKDDGLNTLERMVRAEFVEALYQEILTLPPGCRIICAYSLIDGLKNKEIAERLGTSEQNVSNQVRRGIMLLKGRIDLDQLFG